MTNGRMRWTAAVLGAIVIAGAGAAGPVAARSRAAAKVDWAAIEANADPAIYQVAEGGAIPLNLYSDPSWWGTAFQVYVPSRGDVEVTACHMVCWQTTSGQWDLWPQDMVAPLGSLGYFSPDAFAPGSTTIWPGSDTAESNHIPQDRNILRYKPYLYGRAPAIHGALAMGNFNVLKQNAPLLVLGNRLAAWDQDGYRPVPSVATYLGLVKDIHVGSDAPGGVFPSYTLPAALMIACNSCAPGDSGAPVLNRDGRVVGIFDAYSKAAKIGYVVPLTQTAIPIGGSPSYPVGRA